MFRQLSENDICLIQQLSRLHSIVERSAKDPNRINVLLPPDLVNQLRVFATLVQFRLQY